MARFPEKLRKWRRLEAWERSTLTLAVLWWLPVAGLLLGIVGYRRAHTLMARISMPLTRCSLPTNWQPSAYAQRCAALVAVASCNGLYQARCLPRALALQSVLARRGLAAQVRIGIVPGTEPLQAHAWVDFEGCALGEGDIGEYKQFAELVQP